MLNTEKNIYEYETEVKPNKYASFVLLFYVAGSACCWALNEIGIFQVGKTEMRLGVAVPLLVIMIPLLIVRLKPSLLAKPFTKYMFMAVSSLMTATLTTLITFHSTIMLLFPIFLAMLYRSKTLGNMALTCSLLCTFFTPVLGYLLGTWDVPLFQELIHIATNVSVTVEGATDVKTFESVLKIILFLVMPKLIMVGSCALLMYYNIRLGAKEIENRIELSKLSHRDTLTGLYNRNYYNTICEDKSLKGKVGVIYFDVNGLKAVNDRLGHEAGDIMLKRSAESLNRICDGEANGFRMGGDEFLMLIEGGDENAVLKKICDWQVALGDINAENAVSYDGMVCSMASGYVVGDFSELRELVHQADTLMYRNKARMKASTGVSR